MRISATKQNELSKRRAKTLPNLSRKDGVSVTFQNAIDFTLNQEGGYVNDPHDNGGSTKYGITVDTLSSYRGQACDDSDIRDLTLQEASEIYRKEYWDPLGCEILPPAIALVCFDSAVNSGVVTSAKWLQKAVGTTPDGHIGVKTMQAVKQRMTIDTVDAIINARLSFLKSLSDWKYFGKGWQKRIDALRVKAHDIIYTY